MKIPYSLGQKERQSPQQNGGRGNEGQTRRTRGNDRGDEREREKEREGERREERTRAREGRKGLKNACL